MNQLANYTQAEIVAELKSIAPSQFEKKFAGFSLPQIAQSFAKATQGLDRQAVQLGFETIWQKGFLPDPIMFRQWCLGNKDFSFDDEIADSYVGKSGALANITKWIADPDSPISQAEKYAYDQSYTLWNDIKSEYDRTKAESAFKDFYEQKVKELVKNRVMCQPYIAPIAISTPTERPRSEAEIQAGLEAGRAILASLGAKFKQKQEQVA